MERLSLVPTTSEYSVNSAAIDGAVDVFLFGPDMEPAARTLGSLAVIGWRQDDTNTMGYMVSLIAAMARREYYAQPHADPRQAFTRTLHKINEVVEEFFKSGGVRLAAGIFAIAGGTIYVSKLDKFKILLARDGQVIDILNNVMLFSKEHLEKRRFSSIISGSVQDGDRLLAYHPARNIIAREKLLRGWLLADDARAVSDGLQQLGHEHASFGAKFVHISLANTASDEPQPEPVAPSEKVPPASVSPVSASLARSEAPPAVPTHAWAPRQQTSPEPAVLRSAPPDSDEPEAPRLIPTEFSMASRQGRFSRTFGRVRVMRLDTRGKAVVLASLALIIAGGALIGRSVWFISPADEARRATLSAISAHLGEAESLAQSGKPAEARHVLVAALTSLREADASADRDGTVLAADINEALNRLDLAEPAEPSLIAQLEASTDSVQFAAWSSASDAIWAVTSSDDGHRWLVRIADGSVDLRTDLGDLKPTHLIAHRGGALVFDAAARTILRVDGPEQRTYTIPVQETVRDVAVFSDTVYALTDASILKISDLETAKPVTKQWLADTKELPATASRILVDGNIYVMGPDGVLTTFFKGKKTATVQSSVIPSANWRLIFHDEATFGVADAERMRVYELAIADGALKRTLRLDSQQPLRFMTQGPDGSAITVSSDNRMWLLR